MAKATKSADTKKPIADVVQPGTTAPSDTSKPIITERPMIKDPMMVEGAEGEDKPEEKPDPGAETAEEPPEEAEEAVERRHSKRVVIVILGVAMVLLLALAWISYNR